MDGKEKFLPSNFKNTLKMSDVFKAIADPTRREILLMLLVHEHEFNHLLGMHGVAV